MWKSAKKCENYETILSFSCCPLVFPWLVLDTNCSCSLLYRQASRKMCRTSAEAFSGPLSHLSQKWRELLWTQLLRIFYTNTEAHPQLSVTFLADHGEICHPHGRSTWRPADQPTTRQSTWTWVLFKDTHTRNTCGWACCGLVCRSPCGSPMWVANFAMACGPRARKFPRNFFTIFGYF